MFLTSIWGLLFGIGLPLFAMNSEAEVSAYKGTLWLWIFMAVIGLIAPCLLIMLDKTKTAAGLSAAGTVLALHIHSSLSEYIYSVAYLPQIFMTILAVLYVFVVNPHYITGQAEKRNAKLNAPAPSIFDKRKD